MHSSAQNPLDSQTPSNSDNNLPQLTQSAIAHLERNETNQAISGFTQVHQMLLALPTENRHVDYWYDLIRILLYLTAAEKQNKNYVTSKDYLLSIIHSIQQIPENDIHYQHAQIQLFKTKSYLGVMHGKYLDDADSAKLFFHQAVTDLSNFIGSTDNNIHEDAYFRYLYTKMLKFLPKLTSPADIIQLQQDTVSVLLHMNRNQDDDLQLLALSTTLAIQHLHTSDIDYQIAKYNTDIAITLREKLSTLYDENNARELAKLYYQSGCCAREMNQLAIAKQLLTRSIQILENGLLITDNRQTDNSYLRGTVHATLANCYFDESDLNEAANSYSKSLALLNAISSDNSNDDIHNAIEAINFEYTQCLNALESMSAALSDEQLYPSGYQTIYARANKPHETLRLMSFFAEKPSLQEDGNEINVASEYRP